MKTRFLIFAFLTVLFSPMISFRANQNPPIVAEGVFSAPGLIYDDNLQTETDSLLSLFDQMPSVPVYLKDEPIILSGTNTERGVAYTVCDVHHNPSIFVKQIFYQRTTGVQIANILKHELTHAWLCRQQLMSGHDVRFGDKFKQVGGFGN